MDWKEALSASLGDIAAPEADTTNIPAATPQPTPPPRCRLRIEMDKHGRKGKTATLVSEFQGDEEELARLTRLLQTRLGTGGSHCVNSDEPYDGQILLQGDCRQKAAALLEKEGYRVRVV